MSTNNNHAYSDDNESDADKESIASNNVATTKRNTIPRPVRAEDPFISPSKIEEICKKILDQDEHNSSTLIARSKIFDSIAILNDKGKPYSRDDLRSGFNRILQAAIKKISVRASAQAIVDFMARDGNEVHKMYPDYPKARPATLRGIFISDYFKKYQSKLSNLPTNQRLGKAQEAYQSLSEDQKSRYEVQVKEHNEELHNEMVQFYERHPELKMPLNLKRQTPEFIARRKERQEKQLQKKAGNTEPLTAYAIFKTELISKYTIKYEGNLDKMERKIDKKWSRMTDDDKNKYQLKADEMNSVMRQAVFIQSSMKKSHIASRKGSAAEGTDVKLEASPSKLRSPDVFSTSSSQSPKKPLRNDSISSNSSPSKKKKKSEIKGHTFDAIFP